MIAAGAPIVPASPQPLAPSGLCAHSVSWVAKLKAGAREAIVHQRAGAELTALVDGGFVEGLADALDEPTVHLALYD
jgi:hypothetical protein